MADGQAGTKEAGQAVVFLRALIAAQRDGEAAVQALVAGGFAAAGCTVDRLRYRPAEVPLREEFAGEGAIATEEREAVIARLAGTGGGRSLILFAHPDGEAFQPQHGWRHDPFAGTVADGRLHGWGVADDLAGVAMMVEGVRRAAAGGPLRGDVILASTPSKRHARGVHAAMHHGHRADAAVYLHPAESGVGMREVKALASGQLIFRIRVEGRQPEASEPGHGAFAHTAVNPIERMLPLAAALRALDARRGERVRHPALQAAIGRSTNLLLSRIEGGGKPGRVPLDCTLTAALSFPPGERLTAVQAEVEAAVAEAVAADPWLRQHPPRIEWLSGVTGAEVPQGHPLWIETARAVEAATGAPPQVNPLHTASDIRNPMVQHGIPCVGLGPLCGDLTQNGSRDEWVDVADYARAVDVVAQLIRGWCA
ncbi:M20/M25/M40 family metallo-hydrolase [Roseomonas sp. OT10]|uniref:M20 family metallopeptidase n=1 Tax=Roseomonas cutis TaxID=2897332 RepID=UPI001E4ECB62|nr:M20/M25/M40 family metallo-hydrolase [Roseomonas sp. OT10]UFN49284.1 M20/M25/M40 family metallo-hydrolase [Roseomonas sp. OT10]